MEYKIKQYETYNKEEIFELYESVGWTNYIKDINILEMAFKNSLLIFGAYYNNKLIGLIRVVGDGISIVFIQDILINPKYQRKGIGSCLIKKVIEYFSNVYQIELMTDNTLKTVKFYESLGFKKVEDIGCCSFIKI